MQHCDSYKHAFDGITPALRGGAMSISTTPIQGGIARVGIARMKTRLASVSS